MFTPDEYFEGCLRDFEVLMNKEAIIYDWVSLPTRPFLDTLVRIDLNPLLRLFAWLTALSIVSPGAPALWAEQFERLAADFDEQSRSLSIQEQDDGTDTEDVAGQVQDPKISRMITVIRKDIRRLFSSSPFYKGADVRRSILRITLTWCVSHERPYAQGIHEIVGIIYKVVHDAFIFAKVVLNEETALTELTSPTKRRYEDRSDTDMEEFGAGGAPGWQASPYAGSAAPPPAYDDRPQQQPRALDGAAVFSKADVTRLLALLVGLGPDSFCYKIVAVLMEHMYIWYQEYGIPQTVRETFGILRRIDPLLYKHASWLQNEPLLFIKCFRLLFLRDVPLDLVERLWDFVLWDWHANRPMHVCPYICCCLLLLIRPHLLNDDHSVAMQALTEPIMHGDETVCSITHIEHLCELALLYAGVDIVSLRHAFARPDLSSPTRPSFAQMSRVDSAAVRLEALLAEKADGLDPDMQRALYDVLSDLTSNATICKH